jgi:hypothetical protein
MSPRMTARIAGFFYLAVILSAAFAQIFVRDAVIVRGDAAATAARILASEQSYRWAIAADFLTIVSDVVVAILFYHLLAPVSRIAALTAASFRLIMSAVMAVMMVFHFAPLLLLHPTAAGAVPNPDEAMLFLRLHNISYNIAVMLFGVHCILVGYLIARSTFLPRAIGALLIVAGIGYELNSLANLVVPALRQLPLFPYVLLLGFGVELVLTIWLLAFGVNEARWRAAAG